MTDNYRYELKFVLDEPGLARAKSWIYTSTNMRTAFPERIVHSVYFDDPGYSSVRSNLTGIPERGKIRARWYQLYGNKNCTASPILEIKSRHGRLGKKQKIEIPGLEKDLLKLEYKDLFQNVCTRLNNLIFFDNHFTPTLHTRYVREYFKDTKDVRITFDRQISFMNPLPHTLITQSTPTHYPSIIMEVKFSPEHKLYVASLLRSFNKSAVRHSKYLVGLATFGYVSYV